GQRQFHRGAADHGEHGAASDRRQSDHRPRGCRRGRGVPDLLADRGVLHRAAGGCVLPPGLRGVSRDLLGHPGGDGDGDDHEVNPGAGGGRLRPCRHRHRRCGQRRGGDTMSSATTTSQRTSAPSAAERPRTRLGNRLTLGRSVPMWPALLLLIGFMLGPILYSIYLAFTDNAIRGEGASETSFVGLDNFVDAFTDGGFWNSVALTIVFTVVSAVIGQDRLGLILALLMERANRVITFLVTSIVIGCWILPEVVAGYLLYTFFANEGSLNTILGAIGLPPQDLLFSAPIIAVAFANIWRGTAFSMLVYSAALSSVPSDVYESAAIDGAGPLRRFWSV